MATAMGRDVGPPPTRLTGSIGQMATDPVMPLVGGVGAGSAIRTTLPSVNQTRRRLRSDTLGAFEEGQHVADVRTAFDLVAFVAEELGNSSYLVGDPETGDAVVIDPTRDVGGYVVAASERGWHVRAAVDTHVHNDFISGTRELANLGHGIAYAPIHPDRTVKVEQLEGGEILEVGSLRLRALHTPGHTPEHLSYLLQTADGTALAVFTGGALMVGTVARPDLLGPHHTYEMSKSAYTTSRSVFAELGDSLPVFPTHGGGSFCGTGSGRERTSTVAIERETNPLLAAGTFFEFLAAHTRQGEIPRYYAEMGLRNLTGVPFIGDLSDPMPKLGAMRVFDAAAAGAWIVDIRDRKDFATGHIPNSLAIGLGGSFSAWTGWTVPIDDRVIFVSDSAERAVEARRQLRRIGMDAVQGWISFDVWRDAGMEVMEMPQLTMAKLAAKIDNGDQVAVVDVRQENEWSAGHVPGAVHTLAPDVVEGLAHVPASAPLAVYCLSGYRAALGASLLLRAGRRDVHQISDGFPAWMKLGHPIVTPA